MSERKVKNLYGGKGKQGGEGVRNCTPLLTSMRPYVQKVPRPVGNSGGCGKNAL